MMVVMTAYNRPTYLEQSLRSWRQAGLSRALVMLEPSPQQGQMHDVIQQSDVRVTTFVNPHRMGVLANPWHAFEKGFSLAAEPFVVLAEDDVIVSKDCLRYLAWARDEYAFDDTVLAVCCFSWGKTDGKEHECDDPNHVNRGPFRSPVWGTWQDRWDRYLRDTWQMDYANKGWDWYIQEHVLPKNGLTCIRPCVSRSQHIGEHDGTHTTPSMFDEGQAAYFDPHLSERKWTEEAKVRA